MRRGRAEERDLSEPIGPLDADQCLTRAGWQRVVFASRLRRAELLRLRPTWPCRSVRLHVLRNQPFEFVASALVSFASYAGYELDVALGEYDDSLSDLQVDGADAVLVWLDYGRYGGGPAQIASWLVERLSALRDLSPVPVLVHDQAPAPADSAAAGLNDALRTALSDIPGVHVVDQAAVAQELGARYLDERAAAITGFALGDVACLETARQIGLRWLPAAIGARIRAVVVDLDGTLYEGVLGEDGSAGIRLGPGHQALARRLLELRDRGVFLGLLSRNEPEDVDELFAARKDLPLRPEHFSASSVSWAPKAEGIRTVIKALRIAADGVLFVDDNPGELAAVASEVPGVQCLWADPADPEGTVRALRWYPGLDRLAKTEADALRVADLAAAGRREIEHRGAADPAAYLRSLQVVVTLAEDPGDHLARLHELSMKTNQFNTTLSRMSERELAQRMADPDSRVISAALRDRLSDSGIVCGLICRRDGERLVVDELAVSCRALGRGVEAPLVLAALRRVVAELGSDTIVFPFKAGPRNDPARRWLAEFTGSDPAPTGGASFTWNQAQADAELAAAPLDVRWEDHR
jgi:FkbH-like protein